MSGEAIRTAVTEFVEARSEFERVARNYADIGGENYPLYLKLLAAESRMTEVYPNWAGDPLGYIRAVSA